MTYATVHALKDIEPLRFRGYADLPSLTTVDGGRLSPADTARVLRVCAVASKPTPLIEDLRRTLDRRSVERFVVAVLDIWCAGTRLGDAWVFRVARYLGSVKAGARLAPLARAYPRDLGAAELLDVVWVVAASSDPDVVSSLLNPSVIDDPRFRLHTELALMTASDRVLVEVLQTAQQASDDRVHNVVHRIGVRLVRRGWSHYLPAVLADVRRHDRYASFMTSLCWVVDGQVVRIEAGGVLADLFGRRGDGQ